MREHERETYLWTLLFLLSVITSSCNGQSKVNDFTVATWNTNGAKWATIPDKINIPMVMNYGVQVLAVQEAGKLPNKLELSNPQSNVDFYTHDQSNHFGTVLHNVNHGIDEYNYNTGKKKVFLYVFNRNSYNDALNMTRPNKTLTKQNIVIISQQKADKVILIQHIFTKADRENKNRPALGIVIGNTVFFSLHPEPTSNQNEAPLLINAIQEFMSEEHSRKTWMAMGDFNRTPEDLIKKLNKIPNGMDREVITTGGSTHKRELDYSVIGGPKSYFQQNGFPNAELLLPILQQKNPGLQNPSDHQPVIFKK